MDIKSYPKSKEQAKYHKYAFWDSQPVVKYNEIVGRDQIINENLVKYDNITLNEKLYFKFDDDDCEGIAKFMSKINSLDTKYDYYKYHTTEQIKWMMELNNICFTIRSKANNNIFAVVFSHIMNYQINNKSYPIGNIKFFAVTNKLRNKSLGKIMIKQLNNLLIDKGVKIGAFKSQLYIQRPFCTTRIYHRALNIDVLVENNFTELSESIKLDHVRKELELPNKTFTTIAILDKDNDKDVTKAFELLKNQFNKFNFHPNFDINQFKKIFLDNKFVLSYVIKNNNIVTDFCSVERVIYKIKNSNNVINGCKLFYYTTYENTGYRIIKDLMILSRLRGFAVFSAYDIMGNESLVSDLGFDTGQELLHYNLYNYKIKDMILSQVASI